MDDLTQKKCVPCEGGTPPLKKENIEEFHRQVPGWAVADNHRKISRDFKFKDFKEALAFVNKVGDIAETEGHHPDILIHSWNKVSIELWTHAIGGLSDNDFIMAAKIDALLK
ncbi:MAG: 4a-hydroxytetrahydrobiopterin dehydratase [bacterium]|nr:4a-hydroxytetrahydrobiopterin dehydratase [bacterium]